MVNKTMGGEAHCGPRVRKGLMGDSAFAEPGSMGRCHWANMNGGLSMPGKTPALRVGWDILTGTESASRAVWVMKLSSTPLGRTVGVH